MVGFLDVVTCTFLAWVLDCKGYRGGRRLKNAVSVRRLGPGFRAVGGSGRREEEEDEDEEAAEDREREREVRRMRNRTRREGGGWANRCFALTLFLHRVRRPPDA